MFVVSVIAIGGLFVRVGVATVTGVVVAVGGIVGSGLQLRLRLRLRLRHGKRQLWRGHHVRHVWMLM